ncbi:hypothetical protein BOTBODRAFT_65028 [Botryobasidium botryosum FD-172 SS1]|uniref:Uncharacterized protein n=1 Tax=Botryobasidium botryosum (strain FD-172 SS1) TaxID=930990 RepID=A0A067MX12_BOTB1|nr:hypothetical protein BOTBODRAFT_65028 [Botryobasidium botryosum FD-172 SS1]
MKKAGSLSNGTLSLKFMQRAGAASKVEADKKALKDDSEWHAPDAIRQALGLRTGADSGGSSQPAITYEPSYLPFLFPSYLGQSSNAGSTSTSNPPSNISGRRKFKKNGEEVAVVDTSVASDTKDNLPNDSTTRERDETHDAQVESSSTPLAADAAPPMPKPRTFLRPSGVDAAPPVAGKELSKLTAGARAGKKSKRTTLEDEKDGEKRKKKKLKQSGAGVR